MHRAQSWRIVALAAWLAALGTASAVRAQTGTAPTLRAGVIPADFRLDGRAHGHPWWAAADSIDHLTMVEPEEGGTPAGRTRVSVLANANEIVVGVRCYDPEPKGIVSFSKARDSELAAEDHVVLVFDTYLDSRSGYVFAVNPTGARFDGLVTSQGESVNSAWDAIWQAETARDASGWSAEFRIPIKSLGYKSDGSTWGFNIQRRVQRLQETSRWSGISIDREVYQTKWAGRLTALPQFDLGRGLNVRGAAVGRMRTPAKDADTEYDGDLVLDVTKKFGSNVSSALTINTDFAETEVDVRQINVTRFPLFFPEKRSFFLESSDIFEFGIGLDEENLLPFHSRRIGLVGPDPDDQAAIPINAGGEIHGVLGNTNMGVIVTNTRKVDHTSLGVNDFTFHVPQTTMGAVRVAQNVFEESTIGALATFGDQQGRDNSWLGGLDLTLQTSGFLRDKNLLFGAWGLLNDRDDLNGDKSAFGARIDYPNDLWDVNLSTIRIGDGFDPSLGFVPRNDVQIWDLGIEFNPRPARPWLRQAFHEFSATLFNARDNKTWESYSFTVKPFDWLLESGDQFDAGFEPEGDRPPRAFEIAADVDVAPGSYEWTRYFFGARSAEKRRIEGELRLDFGRYYDGDLTTVEGRLTMKPSALWACELTGERSSGTVVALIDDYEELNSTATVEKDYLEQLFGVRFQFNISPDLQLSSLTQYETESRELGTNNRLRWTFHPFGDLFIVYNHNIQRTVDRRWEFVSNELPVKLQYTMRF